MTDYQLYEKVFILEQRLNALENAHANLVNALVPKEDENEKKGR